MDAFPELYLEANRCPVSRWFVGLLEYVYVSGVYILLQIKADRGISHG